MRRLKSVLLILIALWLPIQAAAAATMPFCRHAPQQAAMHDEAQVTAHCHEQIQMDMSVPAASDVDCDNCQMCHLATAGYLLAGREPMPPLTAAILVPTLKLVSASHIPEPPLQPPRR